MTAYLVSKQSGPPIHRVLDARCVQIGSEGKVSVKSRSEGQKIPPRSSEESSEIFLGRGKLCAQCLWGDGRLCKQLSYGIVHCWPKEFLNIIGKYLMKTPELIIYELNFTLSISMAHLEAIRSWSSLRRLLLCSGGALEN